MLHRHVSTVAQKRQTKHNTAFHIIKDFNREGEKKDVLLFCDLQLHHQMPLNPANWTFNISWTALRQTSLLTLVIILNMK